MKIVIDIPEDMYKDANILIVKDFPELKNAIINSTPYEERPCGKWIVGEYMDCHSDILPKYTCPFCGKVVYRKYDFCHCGADLRGE